MKILIVPGNVQNAKSYPYWDRFIKMANKHEIKVVDGILSDQDIIDLVNWCDIWVSIDSFLPHFVRYHKLKRGVVLWGKSDPGIFGYKENINLLKDRKYLRAEQFKWWIDEPLDPKAFVDPEEILQLFGRM